MLVVIVIWIGCLLVLVSKFFFLKILYIFDLSYGERNLKVNCKFFFLLVVFYGGRDVV